MSEWKPDIFIYHSPCDDGFGAAWAVHQRWGDDVQYVPATYGQRPPEVLGKHVLIGDFSYKRDGIDTCLQGAASLVILDHHKTAEDDLAPFAFTESYPGAISPDDIPGMLRDLAELDRPPAIAIFDMARSGARMCWDFCHPGVPAPSLINYIEDRDLWRFNYPETKAFSLFLRSFPYDFEIWSGMDVRLRDPRDRQKLLSEAEAIKRFYDRLIDQLAGTARLAEIDGHWVPCVNCGEQFASEVGHKLLALNPEAPFAASYSDRHGARGYSLRSENSRMDVSAIARRYGGGGHRNAAGFEVPQP